VLDHIRRSSVRAAGHQSTAEIVAEWGSGDDSYAKNPPNATVSVLNKDGVKDWLC